MENIKPKKQFAMIALLEGISTVVLFFVAMPLKYFAGIENAVKYPGWVHGLLFVLYIGLLINVSVKYSWSFKRVFIYFIASLIPLMPFFVEKELRREIKEAEKAAV
ncbi:MAG TPA: DUF3817 domain-containing protein [Chitinophagaceae bacterium]|nr:DUF3817 domain-containing protein [Chitinophagaceae bacterium]